MAVRGDIAVVRAFRTSHTICCDGRRPCGGLRTFDALLAGTVFSGPTSAQQLGARPSHWVPLRLTHLFAPRR